MKTITDFHVHSTFSRHNHGKSSVEEIVKKASELGLKEIAISDHGLKHLFYGITEDNLEVLNKKISNLRKEYPQMTIKQGIEANILSCDGTTDIDDNVIKYCDIVLCGYHSGVRYKSFSDFMNLFVLNYLARFIKPLRKRQIDVNTSAIVNALKNNNIDILTHPGEKMYIDIDKVAKAAAETNTLLEINNSHGHLSVEEIKAAAKYDVCFVINSDAHIKDKIGGYKNSLKRATEAKLELKRIVNLT